MSIRPSAQTTPLGTDARGLHPAAHLQPATSLHPGARLRIRYQNADGERSDRTIRVSRTYESRYGVAYVRAFCELRGEERTFRASRILAADEPGGRWSAKTIPSAAASPTPAAPARPAATPVPPAPARPAASTPAAAARAPGRSKTPRGGGAVGGVLTVVFAVAAAWALTGTPPGWDPPPQPPPDPIPLPQRPPVSTARPEPLPRELAPAPGPPAAASYPPALRRRYAAADDNGDGRLSWDELSVFQSRLVRDIPYASNSRALSPEEFLAAGSGDCEDFALFTCGLLAYWGIECYLGSLAPKSGGTGHAVALLPVPDVPEGFAFFRIQGSRSASGEPIPSGTYVPIDYEYVGGLSDAAGKGWVLRWIRVPGELYGLQI